MTDNNSPPPPPPPPFPNPAPVNSSNGLVMNPIHPEPGTRNIFYKTRLCYTFANGKYCPTGDRCTFAHGDEELKQPPQNWQEAVYKREIKKALANWNDEEQIIQRMNICRRFYNEQPCPHGNNCNLLHEHPSKFKVDDVSMMMKTEMRENSAISVQNSDHIFEDKNPTSTTHWKNRLCSKWETSRFCIYGERCHFAHGVFELRKPDGVGGNSEDVIPPTRYEEDVAAEKPVKRARTEEEPVKTTGEIESWMTIKVEEEVAEKG